MSCFEHAAPLLCFTVVAWAGDFALGAPLSTVLGILGCGQEGKKTATLETHNTVPDLQVTLNLTVLDSWT